MFIYRDCEKTNEYVKERLRVQTEIKRLYNQLDGLDQDYSNNSSESEFEWLADLFKCIRDLTLESSEYDSLETKLTEIFKSYSIDDKICTNFYPKDLRTFMIKFTNKGFNVSIIAKEMYCEHYMMSVKANTFENLLDELCTFADKVFTIHDEFTKQKIEQEKKERYELYLQLKEEFGGEE